MISLFPTYGTFSVITGASVRGLGVGWLFGVGAGKRNTCASLCVGSVEWYVLKEVSLTSATLQQG